MIECILLLLVVFESICGFINVFFFNFECGIGFFEEEAFFDVIVMVIGGLGFYVNINFEISVSYGSVIGVENGFIFGIGVVSVIGFFFGEVVKIELLD